MGKFKTRHEHLDEATERELLDEVARRRQDALQNCSDEELEEELAKRGVDCGTVHIDISSRPPRLVEK